MSLINNVHNLCLGKNMFISNLEKELGFSNGSVYRWDVTEPAITKVMKVAQYFGVSVDSLLKENGVDQNKLLNTLTTELLKVEQQIRQDSVRARNIKQQLKRLQKLKGVQL